LFWRLKPDPGATDKEKNAFGEALGHLLEAHCVEATARVYNPNTATRFMFREKKYAKTKLASDIAIFEDGVGAFIEIGINRPNLRDTIVRGSLTSYDTDVKKILVKRAEQLSRKIDEFYDGVLTYDGADPSSITSIHPIVCLLDGFPLGAPLYKRAVRIVKEAGLLRTNRAERLAVLSAEELETLLALVERGEALTDVLRRHAGSRMRHESLRDYPPE